MIALFNGYVAPTPPTTLILALVAGIQSRRVCAVERRVVALKTLGELATSTSRRKEL
jgi:hypothetical protein